jgi:hypothetical protein
VPTGDLLLHPVRLRIVQAFLGGRELTTAQLGVEFPDVPPASLYRHVGRLAEAGVLTVVAERKVRGAAERTYRLDLSAASVGTDDLASMTVEEHRRGFATFVAMLLADFERYLEGSGGRPDPVRDRIGYRQAAVWVTDEEFDALAAELAAVLRSRMENRPEGQRRRRLVSTVHLPAG